MVGGSECLTLAGSAIAGVLLTILLIRKSSGGKSAPLPVSAPIGNGPAGPGGTGGVSAQEIAMLLQQVKGQSSSPTAISHTQYNAQDVRDIFSRFGDSNDARIASDTWIPSTETAQARIDRITRDLNSGTRTIDQVTTSISQLPGSSSYGNGSASATPRKGQLAVRAG